MKLLNAVPFRPPILPDFLVPYITWTGNCQPNDSEMIALHISLNAFADEFQQQPDGCRPVRVSLILLNSPDVIIQLENNADCGKFARMILYPIYLWREKHLSQFAMCISILEELCHLFYCEDDEKRVQVLVLRCLRHIWPAVRSEDAYNPHWMPDDSR